LDFLAQFCPLVGCLATGSLWKEKSLNGFVGVEMKRVLFLAVLIVFTVEFTMERDRMYHFFTTVALLALIYGFFHQRHRIRAAPGLNRHTQKEANYEDFASD
jgi:hypothetical protein